MSSEQPREEWRSEPCPSWCTGEHHDDDHPDDRYHDSAPTQVPAIFAERERAAGSGQWAMRTGEITIITSQHVASDHVIVFIGRQDRADQQLSLTPESAARLAQAIEHHLEAAH